MYTYYSYKDLRLLVRRAKCGDADAADSLRSTAVTFMAVGHPLPSPLWEWVRDGLLERHPERLFPPRKVKTPNAPMGPNCDVDMARMVEALRKVGVPIVRSRLSPGAYAIVAEKFGVSTAVVQRAHLEFKKANRPPFRSGQRLEQDAMVSGEVLLRRLSPEEAGDSTTTPPSGMETDRRHD